MSDAERIRELEQALSFYAKPETYFAIGFIADPPCGSFVDDFEETGHLGYKPGKLARSVLEGRTGLLQCQECGAVWTEEGS